MKPFLTLSAFCLAVSFTQSAMAQMIPVGNFSFEDPTITAGAGYIESPTVLDFSSGAGGQFGIETYASSGDVTTLGTGNGGNFAFLNVNPGETLTIDYTGTGTPTGSGTGTDTAIALPTIQAGFNYTLTVALDNRGGAGSDSGLVNLTLTAGTFTFTNPISEALLPTNTFADESVTLNAAQITADGLVGTPLGIELGAVGTTSFVQGDFDNVRLTQTAVPEPTTWALMGFGTLVITLVMHRRRLA